MVRYVSIVFFCKIANRWLGIVSPKKVAVTKIPLHAKGELSYSKS